MEGFKDFKQAELDTEFVPDFVCERWMFAVGKYRGEYILRFTQTHQLAYNDYFIINEVQYNFAKADPDHFLNEVILNLNVKLELVDPGWTRPLIPRTNTINADYYK